MSRKNSRFLTLLQMRLAMRRLLPNARWSLTPPFHPYNSCLRKNCGLFSVALSVEQGVMQKIARRKFTTALLLPVITRHFFRRSPDFSSPPKNVIIDWRRGYISSAIKPYSSDSSSESSISSSSSSSSKSSSSLISSSLSEMFSSSSLSSSKSSSSKSETLLALSIV